MKRKLIVVLSLSLFACTALAQGVQTVHDTLPASLKEGVRGGRKSLSERLIVTKDFSVMASPMGEGDFVKFVQTLPGVSSGSDGSSSYYVRGGNLGGNVQTLDGVPIYGRSHLLGLTTPYSSDVISSAEFLLGGFSSEEGNLSSSHIKLTSADGSFDRISGKADVSNFLLGGTVSAPLLKDRLSLIASLRLSPVGYEYSAISGLMDDDAVNIKKVNAAVYDVYAKLKYLIDAESSLSLSVMNSLDSYDFTLNNSSEDSMSWSNLLAILRYERKFARGHEMTVTSSLSRYSNSQAMLKQMDQTSNNLMIRSLLGEGILQATVNSRLGSHWRASYGLKGRVARFNPGSARELETTGLLLKTGSPLTDNSSVNVTGTLHGQLETGSYSRSLFRLSGRANYNSAGGLSPEVSTLCRLKVTRHLGLELTGDILTQYYHTLEGIPLGWSLEMMVPPSKRFSPEKTKQAYAGLYCDAGNHHFSAGGYYKDMKDLVYFSDATKMFDSALAGWEDNIEVGTGTSRGAELMYEKTGGKASWKVAYTWSKSDRLFPGLNGGEAFPAKYDRRHVLNATATALVKEGDKVDITLSGMFTWQSGHLETVAAGYWMEDNFIIGHVEESFFTSLNNYRMPAYVRCDLSAGFSFKSGRRPRQLNVGVYNILNRHNPFALSYDPDSDTWKQLSLFPIMPSLKYSVSF